MAVVSMTSEEFYAFCSARASNRGEMNREVALASVWVFLCKNVAGTSLPTLEELPTKEEIVCFLRARLREAPHPSLVEAYTWLLLLLGVSTENDAALRG